MTGSLFSITTGFDKIYLRVLIKIGRDTIRSRSSNSRYLMMMTHKYSLPYYMQENETCGQQASYTWGGVRVCEMSRLQYAFIPDRVDLSALMRCQTHSLGNPRALRPPALSVSLCHRHSLLCYFPQPLTSSLHVCSFHPALSSSCLLHTFQLLTALWIWLMFVMPCLSEMWVSH